MSKKCKKGYLMEELAHDYNFKDIGNKGDCK